MKTDKYKKKYSEESFFNKIQKYAKKIGVNSVFYAYLLYYLLTDDFTPIKDKTIIIGALGYLISPLDICPDVAVGIGYIDDFYALGAAINQIKSSLTLSIIEKARLSTKDIFGNNVKENELDNIVKSLML